MLAVWRLSSLIANEDGPFDIFARFRLRAGVYYDVDNNPIGGNVFARGLLCVWCVSIWVAFLFSFVDPNTVNIPTFIVNWLAISAGAILFYELLDFLIRN
jgi:hypothetical protein